MTDDAWQDAPPWREALNYFDQHKFIEPDDAWMDQPIREGLDYLRTQPATRLEFSFTGCDHQVIYDCDRYQSGQTITCDCGQTTAVVTYGQIPTDATITPTND